MFIRISRVLEAALDELNENEINQQPCSECNSIGWIVWHLTRVQDRFVAMLSNNDQVLITEKWHEKFDRVIDDSRTPTVALRLAAFISGNLQHTGQVAYLRGWLKSQAEHKY